MSSSQQSGQTRWLENAVAQLLRQMVDVLARLVKLEQIPWAAAGGGGGGGGGAGCYVCVPSSSIAAASALPPSGTPTALTGQTIYQESGGTYTSVTTSGTVYNLSPSASVTSGKLTFVGQNPDGTWSAMGQAC